MAKIITDTSDIVRKFIHTRVIKELLEYEIEQCLSDVIEIVAYPDTSVMERQPSCILIEDKIITALDKNAVWDAFKDLTCGLIINFKQSGYYKGNLFPYTFDRLLGYDIVLKELDGIY